MLKSKRLVLLLLVALYCSGILALPALDRDDQHKESGARTQKKTPSLRGFNLSSLRNHVGPSRQRSGDSAIQGQADDTAMKDIYSTLDVNAEKDADETNIPPKNDAKAGLYRTLQRVSDVNQPLYRDLSLDDRHNLLLPFENEAKTARTEKEKDLTYIDTQEHGEITKKAAEEKSSPSHASQPSDEQGTPLGIDSSLPVSYGIGTLQTHDSEKLTRVERIQQDTGSSRYYETAQRKRQRSREEMRDNPSGGAPRDAKPKSSYRASELSDSPFPQTGTALYMLTDEAKSIQPNRDDIRTNTVWRRVTDERRERPRELAQYKLAPRLENRDRPKCRQTLKDAFPDLMQRLPSTQNFFYKPVAVEFTDSFGWPSVKYILNLYVRNRGKSSGTDAVRERQYDDGTGRRGNDLKDWFAEELDNGNRAAAMEFKDANSWFVVGYVVSKPANQPNRLLAGLKSMVSCGAMSRSCMPAMNRRTVFYERGGSREGTYYGSPIQQGQ